MVRRIIGRKEQGNPVDFPGEGRTRKTYAKLLAIRICRLPELWNSIWFKEEQEDNANEREQSNLKPVV